MSGQRDKTWWTDVTTALRRGPRVWADVAIATWELARANREFLHRPAAQLDLLGGTNRQQPNLSRHQQALVERVAYIVPIMGLRLPWRADCVVQALAARRWLGRGGVPTVIRIGVRKETSGFEAHAWATVGDRIVTGGEVTSYAELPPGKTPEGLFP